MAAGSPRSSAPRRRARRPSTKGARRGRSRPPEAGSPPFYRPPPPEVLKKTTATVTARSPSDNGPLHETLSDPAHEALPPISSRKPPARRPCARRDPGRNERPRQDNRAAQCLLRPDARALRRLQRRLRQVLEGEDR